MWFKKLVGFVEENSEQVRSLIVIDGNVLTSKVNGKKYNIGTLEILSLEELRKSANNCVIEKSKIKVTEIMGDVKSLHSDIENNHALFQVASQFNLLEMCTPNKIPEDGIDIYEYDLTQGPSCAIACGAATIYRNYFINFNANVGQSKEKQIDCLEDLGLLLGNDKLNLWKMKNGYALLTLQGISKIDDQIKQMTQMEIDELKCKLKIGLLLNSDVTINNSDNIVSQVFCSALPLSYLDFTSSKVEAFAKLILEATYEATFHSAIINFKQNGNPTVFITLIGGGVFENEIEWILEALKKTILKFGHTPLDVKIVSFLQSNKKVRELLETLKNEL